MDENKLIEAVRAGDVEAYAGLVGMYQAKVRLVCISFLHNLSEADDAAQDAFIKAFEALPSFKREASFGTWISHIAANHCRDLLRARQRHQTDSLDALIDQKGDHLHALLSDPSPGRTYSPEDLELVGRVFSTLPEDEREILTLREMEELSYDEIASKLQCTLDAVKGRLKRARQRLTDACRKLFDTSAGPKRP